ncbi:hypothetical protein QC761_0034080 [Podospora bellae-mahoneyi]|uniref:Uncharacterized protein n=1 Tax=Podospora bellae-mahoneyi TaxID=2093777 RepID=A0ABR0FRJ3_9PEZI|nr:hypothetical protein QC761_0034080 [Podospora bellae-mahoneyi]
MALNSVGKVLSVLIPSSELKLRRSHIVTAQFALTQNITGTTWQHNPENLDELRPTHTSPSRTGRLPTLAQPTAVFPAATDFLHSKARKKGQ